MPHKYTKEQIAWLKVNRPLHVQSKLSDLFHKEFGTYIKPMNLANTCKRHGIKTGRSGQFVKGHIPFNAGMTGIRHSTATEFKKGNVPHTYLPVGTISKREDYTYIKIADPRTWQLLHMHIWGKVHGKIPESQCIIFIDSNKDNVVIENLALVKRKELLRLNKNNYSFYPDELKPSVLALSKLESKIFEVQHG